MTHAFRLALLPALAAAALSLVPGAARAAGEFKAHGFTLPAGAVRIDEDRYRLPAPWDETLRFYRSVLPPARFPRHTLHNQAGVKAIHIANAKAGEEWEGINLYEAARGEVRLFILARKGEGEEGKVAPGKEAEKQEKKK